MDKIYTKPRAKINLSLSVLEKRQDNYHNLQSVFQKINLYDEMWVEKTDTNDIEIESNIKQVNLEDNIIYKAYKKLKSRFPQITGIKVKLIKKIPMQAGLAGGSTDAASFLLAIKKMFEIDVSDDEYKKIASSLGADVVPCMYNEVIKAEGIGDIITKINANFKYYLVIVKPHIFCSTKDMYDKLDERDFVSNQKSNQIIEALEQNNVYKLSKNLYNDFEEVSKDIKEIAKAKNDLIKNGALNALLAGSGSAVFGIFENKEKAKYAYQSLKENYEVYICSSYNKREK